MHQSKEARPKERRETYRNAPALLIPLHLLVLPADPNDNLLPLPCQTSKTALGSYSARAELIAVVVQQRAIALCRSEELGDDGHAEPVAEGVPYIWTTAVAVC